MEIRKIKNYFFNKISILFFVVFFGMALTMQIAAIKLVGGFFYVQNFQKILVADHKIEMPKLAGPDYLSSGLFYSALIEILILMFVFCAMFLDKGKSLLILRFFRSDCIHIRPPSVN